MFPKKERSLELLCLFHLFVVQFGTLLVLFVAFGIPSFRSYLLGFANQSDTVSTSSVPNVLPSGTVSEVSLKNYSDTAILAANKALPSIVGISVKYSDSSTSLSFAGQEPEAQGSGIIISSDGYILTNNHIINSSGSSYYEVSKASMITVSLYNDDTVYPATIIGEDKETDLAVIKIDKTNLVAAELGNSDEIKIGEFALAVGNPLGLESSVTSGIISGVNRSVSTSDSSYLLIQTDAAINSGNSGGALVNSNRSSYWN